MHATWPDDGELRPPRESLLDAGSVGAALGRWLRRPPGWPFHVALALPTLALLWSVSYPGIAFFLAGAAVLALGGAALLWFLRLVVFVALRRTASWAFLIAPVGGLLVAGLIAVDAPVKLRWEVSESSFDAVVRTLPAPGPSDDSEWPDVPARIGSYGIYGAQHVPDGGILFYEETGAFINDAGFAYLPEGPTRAIVETLETPYFRHLSGRWYAFTASW